MTAKQKGVTVSNIGMAARSGAGLGRDSVRRLVAASSGSSQGVGSILSYHNGFNGLNGEQGERTVFLPASVFPAGITGLSPDEFL